MKINRKTVLSTAAVLGVAALVAGGTIAYFTDHETATNSFTVGKVDITLYESQLHRVNSNVKPQYNETSNASPVSTSNYFNCLNGNVYCTPNIAVTTDLSGVSAWQNGHVRAQNVAGVAGASQAGVFTDAQIRADAVKVGDTDSETPIAATATNPGNYAGYVASEYQYLVPGQQVRKFVYVQNDGNSNAYVRVRVTIPSSVADKITVKVPHTPTETSTASGNTNIDGIEMGAYLTASEATDDTTGNKILTFVYTDALKPGELTYWSPITTVKINDGVDMSDFSTDTLNSGFGITVDADAIQAGGFASAAAAFEAYDTQNNS